MHLEHLNPEQLSAVTLHEEGGAGHALVLAGAGSGKTRVLTTRIAWLIQSGHVTPGGVLAVTFTNKAAREMVTRLTAMLPLNPRGLWIGTFHGLSNRLLRTHSQEAGLPREFQILDTQDQLSAVKRLARALNVDEDRFPPRDLQRFINGRKEEGLRAGDVPSGDDLTRRQVEFFAAYDEQCRREGVADFAELMLRSYELLARNEILRSHYQARFRYILVDEFQDTNRLQYRWLKLFAGPGSRLLAVGDDDQSIYGFRGANVGNLAEFEKEYSQGRVIRLEQNYRSQGNILDAANALISNNTQRLGKNLWTSEGQGDPLRVFEGESDADEARFIAEEVNTMKREGMRLSDIAVLYRSNAQSRVLEHALFGASIAYRVYGGLRFFERAEVKNALAYLRLIANPADDTSFLRVANFPPRGFGARSMEQLQEAARPKGIALYDAVGLDPRSKGGNFRKLIGELKIETTGLPLPEMVEHVIHRSGLIEHYKNEREGADRVENLEELVNAAAAFTQNESERAGDVQEEDQAAEPMSPLVSFLTHAALEAGDHQASEGQDALQLMTVHSAKGLEFNAVFMSGLEEGLFPHEQSAMEKNGLEEERRLAYVAITRARQRLYLTFA
ncbi:MAG: UvrD-helicase domain-containing protein, partial [Candidatus Parcubacteria bacterium]|nr:UvrD-helicase domain-containing protein [Burkholderiales bacterium]